MTLPLEGPRSKSTVDNEARKFRQSNSNKVFIAFGTDSDNPLLIDWNTGVTVPPKWDDIQLSYTGDNLTQVEWYLDGTLLLRASLSYSGDNLTRVQDVTP